MLFLGWHTEPHSGLILILQGKSLRAEGFAEPHVMSARARMKEFMIRQSKPASSSRAHLVVTQHHKKFHNNATLTFQFKAWREKKHGDQRNSMSQ